MLSVYRTLSTRYLSKRWVRAVLIVASISLGVATLVATRALSETMSQAGLQASNPLAGTADLIVTGGGSDKVIDLGLKDELLELPGIKSTHPRFFTKVKLPDHGHDSVLLIGVDLLSELGSQESEFWTVTIEKDPFDIKKFPSFREPKRDRLVSGAGAIGLLSTPLGQGSLAASCVLPAVTPTFDFKALFGTFNVLGKIAGNTAGIVGKDLREALPEGTKQFKIQPYGANDTFPIQRVGTVDARGPAVALGGNILIVEINAANAMLGLNNKVHRIDLTLEPDAQVNQVKEAVDVILAGRAEVHTPDEQNQMVQSVFSGMQTGFSLCGLAALVVGLFLVYNALAVSVAERRHEIGVIISLGATRQQVQLLFAGEAALLGLIGSLLGIPLGIGLAYLGLQPVQRVLRDVVMEVNADQVHVSPSVIVLAFIAGTLTAIAAALVPAISAAGENPAEAVRRIPPKPTWKYRVVQILFSCVLLLSGVVLILLRKHLPQQMGTFGGMVLVLLGALVATPLLAAVAAKMMQPFLRQIVGIEGRLAADNLVRAPGRTGLVIAALAAGVCLVMQIAGTIKSNREALRDWVEKSISADLIVTSGSAIGAGGQHEPIPQSLAEELETSIPEIDRALPIRMSKHTFQDKQIMILALAAGEFYEMESRHKKSDSLYDRLSRRKNGVVISENFRALHRVRTGDTISLTTPQGPVTFDVLGEKVDYTWNHGTIIMNRRDYLRLWNDNKVDIFDVFLKRDADPESVREKILRHSGVEHGLVVQTRGQLQAHIDSMIERLYSIAYAQLVVVMFVAALGVVTALLISVLQRRREMGLLRAIGASQTQVVRSVLAEASLMGVIGTIIGLIVGVPMEWYVLQVVLLEESGYFFALYIPWIESLIIAACAIFLATIAGLGPALYAVRQRIPEAIAYE